MEVDVSDTSSRISSEKQREEAEKEDNATQSVVLSIWRTSKSHRYNSFIEIILFEHGRRLFRSCIVCPKIDSPSMHVLSDEQHSMVFASRGLLVSKGARCCSHHLYKGHLSYESLQSVQRSRIDDVNLDKHDVKKLIDDFRLAFEQANSFVFDNPASLDNQAYETITGLDRGMLVNTY